MLSRLLYHTKSWLLQITKIIRGAYNPLLPSRSPELRQLIASLLVLDARKRPSINQVLAMPLLRARIARFLDQTLQVRREGVLWGLAATHARWHRCRTIAQQELQSTEGRQPQDIVKGVDRGSSNVS
jgi:hypothetical protein